MTDWSSDVATSDLGGQGRRVRPGLVDVAALRHAGHDDGAGAVDHRAAVDVAERPVAEAGRLQLGDAAGCVGVVAGGAGEAGLHQADFDRTLDRLAVARQLALGRLRLRVAESVLYDILCAHVLSPFSFSLL